MKPSPLETFNHLMDKPLAPDISRADPALCLRALLGGLIYFHLELFSRFLLQTSSHSTAIGPLSSSHRGDAYPKESISHRFSPLSPWCPVPPRAVLPPHCSASRAGGLFLRVYSVIKREDTRLSVLILTFP